MTLTGKTKTKIVLASLLKPVDDTRMYEKFGLSLARTGRYEIHIAGYYSDGKPAHPDIRFYPLFRFRRLSLKRFLAPLKYYIFLVKAKPEVVIVQSPDYLIVTCLFKILFGSKILYDVQENYSLNIRHTNAFPKAIRRAVASLVRAVEEITASRIDHFILAEKIYAGQLLFAKNRHTLIENKYNPDVPLPPETKTIRINKDEPLKLVYTGTIAENYGIFEAIDLANKLSVIYPEIRLEIIGRAIQADIIEKVRRLAEKSPHILLNIGREPVKHDKIVQAIQSANLGVLPYRFNKSTEGRIPTKLFEYMAHKLPVLIPQQAPYEDLCASYRACMVVDFANIDAALLLKQLFKTEFYSTKTPRKSLLWVTEGQKLIKLLDSITQ